MSLLSRASKMRPLLFFSTGTISMTHLKTNGGVVNLYNHVWVIIHPVFNEIKWQLPCKLTNILRQIMPWLFYTIVFFIFLSSCIYDYALNGKLKCLLKSRVVPVIIFCVKQVLDMPLGSVKSFIHITMNFLIFIIILPIIRLYSKVLNMSHALCM